jgi:DNA-binding NarL/FixJ family response regulator
MIRVFLVDDHPVVRSGYRRLLEQERAFHVVGEASHADEALQWLIQTEGDSAGHPAVDVIVSDVSMPNGDVWLLLRALAAQVSAPRVLICSMHDDPLLVRRCLDSGAAGYVSKNAPPLSLLDAVRLVHDGLRYVSEDIAPVSQEQQQQLAVIAALSPRERDIWRLLASGLSAAQCAEQLALSHKTVANYQTTIKDKLQVTSVSALVHLAQKYQWLVESPLRQLSP